MRRDFRSRGKRKLASDNHRLVWFHTFLDYGQIALLALPRRDRTKLDSVELEDKAPESHVASTDQDRFGDIFRRNTPYGTVMDHGTMFVGFAAEQRPLAVMLESMAGLVSGERDALTRYTRPLTGAYYFVPSVDSLLQISGT